MDDEQRLFARKMFRLRVHEAKGSAYQQLFESVMRYRNSDFIPIKPYGNVGDRKNDGYCPSSGTFFQVYAPEHPDAPRTAVAAAEKAQVDFAGLLDHWNSATPVKDYRFVFNDSYRGSPPPLEDALAKIRNGHPVAARVMLARDLEDEAMKLDVDQLIDVIQCPIPRAEILESVDFGVLRDVVTHVLSQPLRLSPELVLAAPDFSEKIAFNGLSKHVAALLQFGSYQNDAVASYFALNAHYAKQALRNHLAGIYADSWSRFASRSLDEVGDLVFFDILDRITPKTDHHATALLAQQAAIVVMAFYFEACDIFESPDASS